MMKCRPSEHDLDALVVQARQAYRRVLARHGLLIFKPKEVARARAMMESQGDSRINPDDIRFQASVIRLRSRNLSREAVEDAVRELIEAECECDQARWERDCHRAALMEHLRFKLPPRGGDSSPQARTPVKPSSA
jgi:hypothetical protein